MTQYDASKLAIAVLLTALAGPAVAQQPMPGSGMPMEPAATGTNASPSSAAFKAADETMMRDMNRPMTGNADQDFVAGMLPHHQGAVGLAKIELQYGKSPEMRRLAQGIVAAQEKEIAQMRAWQKRHPPRS